VVHLLVSSGYGSPDEILNLTAEQINLYAQRAAKAKRLDYISQANIAAVGAGVGFTGNIKPLRALESQLEGGSPVSAVMKETQKTLGKMIQAGTVKVHGSDNRRAPGKTGRGHKRLRPIHPKVGQTS
jgi:hypothetical protein